jgi:hypothetical protein
MMRGRRMLIVAGLLSLTIVALLGYQFVWRGPDVIRLPVVEDCKLNLEPCSSSLPMGGRIVFEINPRQPPAGDPLHLRADFHGLEADAVGVRFRGINMNMGQLEYLVHELSPIDTPDGSVSFEGQGGVFVCSIGLMRWLALVKVQVGETVFEVPFNFETNYSGI